MDLHSGLGSDLIIGGKYRLDVVLGEGASGVVHRAVHLGLKKTFAVKLLKASPGFDGAAGKRFQGEATALGALDHAGIVDVTDFGIDDASGQPYLVMEHLHGVTLAEHVRTHGPLDPAHHIGKVATARR